MNVDIVVILNSDDSMGEKIRQEKSIFSTLYLKIDSILIYVLFIALPKTFRLFVCHLLKLD